MPISLSSFLTKRRINSRCSTNTWLLLAISGPIWRRSDGITCDAPSVSLAFGCTVSFLLTRNCSSHSGAFLVLGVHPISDGAVAET